MPFPNPRSNHPSFLRSRPEWWRQPQLPRPRGSRHGDHNPQPRVWKIWWRSLHPSKAVISMSDFTHVSFLSHTLTLLSKRYTFHFYNTTTPWMEGAEPNNLIYHNNRCRVACESSGAGCFISWGRVERGKRRDDKRTMSSGRCCHNAQNNAINCSDAQPVLVFLHRRTWDHEEWIDRVLSLAFSENGSTISNCERRRTK